MFSVSTKAQYGIRALVHLARGEESGGPEGLGAIVSSGAATVDSIVTGSAIAKAENISPKYLEGILAQLTSAGLLLSERG